MGPLGLYGHFESFLEIFGPKLAKIETFGCIGDTRLKEVQELTHYCPNSRVCSPVYELPASEEYQSILHVYLD